MPHASRPPLVAVDANALDDAGARGEGARLLALHEAGRLTLTATAGVRREIDHPATPAGLRAAILGLPPLAAPAPGHAATLDRIRTRAILRGDAPSAKHEADALHVAEAAEAGCAVFLTRDQRVLRRRPDLRSVYPALRITTPERLLREVGPDQEV